MKNSCIPITLDLHRTAVNETVALKQGDTGLELGISLSEGGFPYEIAEDCYAVLTAEKPDGTILYNHCRIEGNTLIYEVTPQTTAAAGRVKAEVKLYGGQDQLITSATFRMIVSGTVYSDDKVESKDEISALTHLVGEAAAVIFTGNETIEQGQQIIRQAETAAQEARTAAGNARQATDDMLAFLEEASRQVNDAVADVSDALLKAGEAQEKAAAAQKKVDQIEQDAQKAAATAKTASAEATTALAEARETKQVSEQTIAEAAQALQDARTALSHANTAQGNADGAVRRAEVAMAAANIAAETAAQTIIQAQEAVENARNVIRNADGAAASANAAREALARSAQESLAEIRTAVADGADTPSVVTDARGSIISLEDSARRLNRGLKVYGRTTQNAVPAPAAPVPLESAGDRGTVTVKVGVSEMDENPQILTIQKPAGVSTFLPGIKVNSGGNYTDENGQQWVCDEVDFTTGKYIQRIGRKTFGELSGWSMDTDRPNRMFFVSFFEGVTSAGAYEIAAVMSNAYKPVSNYAVGYDTSLRNGISYQAGYMTTTNNKMLFVRDDRFTDVDSFISGTAHVVLQYILVNPIEHDLSPEELAAYAALHTNYPSTAIYNDGGAGMEVRYVADTRLYIDKKFAQLAAALVNNV